MEFVGLSIGELMTLMGGMSAGVVLLYILKLRRRQVVVPFSPLWHRVLTEKETTSLWRKLKRWLSLLLQLIILALIVLAIADPEPKEELLVGRNLLILIDTSASMAAVDGDDESRLDEAKKEAHKILGTLGPNDKTMIVTMDGQIRPLTPFTDDLALLNQAIREISVTATPEDLTGGLQLASDALKGRKNPELILLSDLRTKDKHDEIMAKIPSSVGFKHFPFGSEGGNVAITGFNVRRYPANKLNYEVYVQVESYFDQEVKVYLKLYGENRLLEVHEINLEPYGKKVEIYPNFAAGSNRLMAEVTIGTDGIKDNFPLDDKAYALIPITEQLRVLLVTRGNLFLEAPFLVFRDYVKYDKISPAGYKSSKGYDVIVFDDWLPERLPKTNMIVFNPSGPSSPWTNKGIFEDLVVNRSKRKHSLLKWVVLKDLNIDRGQKLKLQKGDVGIAWANSNPVIIARETKDHKIVAFPFDLANSDLPMRMSFPILIVNALDWFTQDDNSLYKSYRTGVLWYIPLPEGASVASIIDPNENKAEIPIFEDQALFYGMQPGFHTLETNAGKFDIAANFTNPHESDITPTEEPLTEKELPAEERVESDFPFLRKNMWIYLLAAVLLLLLLEWMTYHRRITV